jgi:hypothetical protein
LGLSWPFGLLSLKEKIMGTTQLEIERSNWPIYQAEMGMKFEIVFSSSDKALENLLPLMMARMNNQGNSKFYGEENVKIIPVSTSSTPSGSGLIVGPEVPTELNVLGDLLSQTSTVEVHIIGLSRVKDTLTNILIWILEQAQEVGITDLNPMSVYYEGSGSILNWALLALLLGAIFLLHT